jgi:hypothetical protein
MNILNLNFRRNAGLVGAALLAAACGGGGGDSGSTAVVVPTAVRAVAASASSDLTLASAGSFAGVLARTVMGAADGGVSVLASSRESPMARLSGHRGSTLRMAANAAARGAAGSGREAAQGITVETVACGRPHRRRHVLEHLGGAPGWSFYRLVSGHGPGRGGAHRRAASGRGRCAGVAQRQRSGRRAG